MIVAAVNLGTRGVKALRSARSLRDGLRPTLTRLDPPGPGEATRPSVKATAAGPPATLPGGTGRPPRLSSANQAPQPSLPFYASPSPLRFQRLRVTSEQIA